MVIQHVKTASARQSRTELLESKIGYVLYETLEAFPAS